MLAAGLAHVMFDESLADQEFVSQVADDVEAFRQQLGPWRPDRVARTCGIDAEVVVRITREFATARPSLIRCGVAPQQTAGGEAFVRALSALAILGGHWRLAGGGLFMETVPAMDESRAAPPDLRPRPSRSLDIARLGEHLTSDALSPPVMGLMVWGTNPAVVQLDAGRVREGLAREDPGVSHPVDRRNVDPAGVRAVLHGHRRIALHSPGAVSRDHAVLSWQAALVVLSGAAALAGGMDLVFRKTRRAAGVALVVLLVAVFPANVELLARDRAQGAGWFAALLVAAAAAPVRVDVVGLARQPVASPQ